MRLELDQNASAVAQLEPRTAAGSNGSTKSHFDEVLSNGITAAQAGHRAQARILLQYAVELDPKSEAGWLWLASISEYPEELLIFLDRVLDINSKNTRALEWKTATKQLMAKTFVQRGIDAANEERNNEAMSCFDTALSYDEHNQLAWFWKDSLSSQAVSEEPEVASLEPVVPEFLEIDKPIQAPSVPVISKFEEAETALAGGNRELALILVNEAIDQEPESENAWALRSHLVDDFDEKRRSLERVVQINPENMTARASLETLMAMVETVAPNSYSEPETANEAFSPSPFDSIAAPVASVDGRTPTQELELPPAILQNNPFVTSVNCEPTVNPWVSEAGIDPDTDEPNRSSDPVSADDYPTILVPFDEAAEPLYVAEQQNVEVPEPQSVGDLLTNNLDYSETAYEVPPVQDVQQVSASTYLEDASAFQYQEYKEPEPAQEAWQEESSGSQVAENGDNNTWVVEDSDAYTLEDMAASTAKTILVVDDSAVVRKLISGKLEECGYNVIATGSGVEALAAISNSRPDLVLLDIAMPKMDGYQVCEKIRMNESTRDIPVVMISGKDGYFDEDRAQKAGTSSFISKPFGPETLMKALDTYLPASVTQ